MKVWPLLAKIPEKRMDELKEAYRVLNTRWTPHDQAIQRDIGRTFPAHQYFKESAQVLTFFKFHSKLFYSKLKRNLLVKGIRWSGSRGSLSSMQSLFTVWCRSRLLPGPIVFRLGFFNISCLIMADTFCCRENIENHVIKLPPCSLFTCPKRKRLRYLRPLCTIMVFDHFIYTLSMSCDYGFGF